MAASPIQTPQELQNENVPRHLIPHKEWCEKQMEFSLLFGKSEKTKAMKAGIARHAVLEEEIDELMHEAELYMISWHLLHFLKDYIFLDRCV
ncbi:uncharacterized protein LOC114300669 isoform X4 [Camellia sinensis]|uniref:uncharacterized protein LOC114300669 isoform X4 n=1 Tax=Camellia sinensis TaxID=4442 RepID=UPI001035F3EF|nr:uncharacterized protein LOC114300669 isoform X4 [Camellia sinensis]XP_028101328.1 uncharacterized protein LOC114300669 isoform X4 [Camellia sinensis]XP_028101329.1 uncharacterized protein LOC114300669 isoform X4 [Camellia sinensis]